MEYPAYFQSQTDWAIYQFTELTKGTVIVRGQFRSSPEEGTEQAYLVPHTDTTQWVQVEPPIETLIAGYIDIQAIIYKPTGKMLSYGLVNIPWNDERYLPWMDSDGAFLDLIRTNIYGFSKEDTVVLVDHPKYQGDKWYNRCYTRMIQKGSPCLG